jgi:hypothetical protein
LGCWMPCWLLNNSLMNIRTLSRYNNVKQCEQQILGGFVI